MAGGNKLGYLSSSRRYKHDIQPMGNASEALFALTPVSFRYNGEIDPSEVEHFGLIAEEVEKANSDLVVHNPEGKPETVRYESVNAMLLNEFLKEHRKVEEQNRKLENQHHRIGEQEATITQLKKQMEAVVARLSEHDSKIQEVSAQIQVKSISQMTLSLAH